LSLLVNGQAVQSEQISSGGDYTLTYIPGDATGSVQLEAQVTDSVLYNGTDTQTINIKTASSFLHLPGNTNNSSGSGKKGTLTSAKRGR
jgi:hypothetical protein